MPNVCGTTFQPLLPEHAGEIAEESALSVAKSIRKKAIPSVWNSLFTLQNVGVQRVSALKSIANQRARVNFSCFLIDRRDPYRKALCRV